VSDSGAYTIMHYHPGRGSSRREEVLDVLRSTGAKIGKRSSRPQKDRTRAHPDIAAIMRDGRAIDRAINSAIREALLQHKRAGNPIAVWSRGKVVWLKPEEI
jgi:hypothetical protein